MAYYFRHGSSEMVVQFLKEVTETCQDTGLHAVATVRGTGLETVGCL